MKRKALKTLSSSTIDFIPKEYEDMEVNAEDIYERPLIFVGKRMTRDQRFEFQECMKVEYPEGIDVSKLTQEDLAKISDVSGKSKAYKYVWENCIIQFKNVILEIEGKDEAFDVYTDKDMIWNAEGLNSEIIQAIAYFISESSFSEDESKN